ncbi:MAG TPA: excinuclease ABC subunit UvrC [Geminicoccus sp.]|uniref:excinuclease ABC subunit UvrC n=1 Tax=Geminicoccus sp. TaxID=2024832 RepID=UPI002E318DA3|nr:excinuclease ABC subunit UvrC [Geminicoccus sp.]HEX2525456.1 excinuclease ABC subunit UvrC [Geminicoccus sp.]
MTTMPSTDALPASPPPEPTPVPALDPAALRGADLIRHHVARLPNSPGVYRMLGEKGEALYVGKAKSLKKRVVAYTRPEQCSARIRRMIVLTRSMEFVSTNTEVEALLLEANMIKQLRPHFNILLRDDKSFPFIAIDTRQAFPQIRKHRGARQKGVDYFGPFASSGAVDQTLKAVRRAFPLRSCKDSIFQSRSRPCLEYQIKRCSAPCVGRVSEEEYRGLVGEVKLFLAGRSREVQERLQADMMQASEDLSFERAAAIRDRIKALAHVTAHQGINTESVDDADVVALSVEGGAACVQVFFYRGGRNNGNRPYYPAHTKDVEPSEILEAFLAQFYADRVAPPLVLLSEEVPSRDLLVEALSFHANRRIEIAVPKRGDKLKLVDLAQTNARQALARRLAEEGAQSRLLEALGSLLDRDEPPRSVEIYDNSHIQGSDAVGVCVRATSQGFDKSGYRIFSIKDPTTKPGDDFAMMREVFTRRFARLQKEDPDRSTGLWPDVVMIDGGVGQLSSARAVLDELGIEDQCLVAVSKGPDRDAGREKLHLPARDEPIALEQRDPLLYFIQRLRDEAHRFAITSHRSRRGKRTERSALDSIPGIGPRRKKALLAQFGSARGVAEAGIVDLERVPGVSAAMARAIHDHFRGG